MDIAKQFEKWLKEICRWGRLDYFIQEKDILLYPGFLYSRKIGFYTKNNEYTIKVIKRKSGETYLGCVVSSRKPRAGESRTRGNDLPDGDFSRKTWEKIKNAIIAYELVKVAKPTKEMSEAKEGLDKE